LLNKQGKKDGWGEVGKSNRWEDGELWDGAERRRRRSEQDTATPCQIGSLLIWLHS